MDILSDKDLLDGLERLVAEDGVVLRSCRSGVKITLGFEGMTAMREFFGGPELGQVMQGVNSATDWFVEGAGPQTLGGNVRALLTKAIKHASDNRQRQKLNGAP